MAEICAKTDFAGLTLVRIVSAINFFFGLKTLEFLLLLYRQLYQTQNIFWLLLHESELPSEYLLTYGP
jgi:hypothetical protein